MDVERKVSADFRGFEKVEYTCRHDNTEIAYTVKVINPNYALWGIECSGVLPKHLAGATWTSDKNAIKALKFYLDNKKPTVATRGRKRHEERQKEKNAAVSQSSDS